MSVADLMEPVTVAGRDAVDDGVLDLRVVGMRYEAEDVLSIVLRDPEGGTLPAWSPGAHIDLDLGGSLRQFSLCGKCEDPFTYRVAVLREERSRGGSRFVHERLRPGDMVEVGGPRNHFGLADDEEFIFIAGGIGITPILTMIREVERRKCPWRLVYGGRRRASMAFAAELAAFGERVEIVPEDENGLLDLDAILGGLRAGIGVYCCGPAGLLTAVEQRSERWPFGALHVERFQAQKPPDVQNRSFVVECRRSARELPVPADSSLLEVLERAGYGVPSACREGICGSCEVTVLDGEIEHRDSVLGPVERASGDRMMSCVSRAAGEQIAVDL